MLMNADNNQVYQFQCDNTLFQNELVDSIELKIF